MQNGPTCILSLDRILICVHHQAAQRRSWALSVKHAASCDGVCRKWESTAVSIRSQGMGKRAMAWLHTHTHRCLQLRKTALNIGGSTVAGTKNLHRLSKACLSGKNTALQLQKSHFQAPNQTSARDSRIPLLGHKCTTASEFGSATRH